MYMKSFERRYEIYPVRRFLPEMCCVTTQTAVLGTRHNGLKKCVVTPLSPIGRNNCTLKMVLFLPYQWYVSRAVRFGSFVTCKDCHKIVRTFNFCETYSLNRLMTRELFPGSTVRFSLWKSVVQLISEFAMAISPMVRDNFILIWFMQNHCAHAKTPLKWRCISLTRVNYGYGNHGFTVINLLKNSASMYRNAELGHWRHRRNERCRVLLPCPLC